MSDLHQYELNHINEVADIIVKDKDPESTKVSIDEIQENFKNRSEIFAIGDLVKVYIRIIEGKRERIQIYEGYVIATRGHGLTTTFKVRKNSFGVGVEKTFPLYSPKIEKIELVRKGKIRRAKLYYLRDRKGKKANIKEKINFKKLSK